MSGDFSSTSDVAAASAGKKLVFNALIAPCNTFKRPCSPSSDVSGSNKCPRSDDALCLDYVNYDEYVKHAYKKLTSDEFFITMARGRFRVQILLSSSSKETWLSDHLIARLNDLLVSFTDLLTSKTNLGTANDAVEQSRLLNLAKQILRDWEGIEDDLPQREQHPFSWWYMAPIDRPHAVPSPWLLEYSWRDMAYEEVLSLRKKYSYLLDQAYLDSYKSYAKRQGGSGFMALSRKKLLTFLGSSREDIDSMCVEECYKRVMRIKHFCIRKEQPICPVSLCASGNSTAQIQLPNWRDKIYDQIAASRKKYSLKLDELLRDEDDQMKSSGTPDEVNTARFTFMEEALQFLAHFRDGIAFLSEETCREKLAAIHLFMGQFEDDLPPAARQSKSPGQSEPEVNWRDLAYEQLQVCCFKFMYLLYDVYLTYRAAWSKMPVCDEDMSRLESNWTSLLKFYKMSRAEMSLLFKSKEDYYDECESNLMSYLKDSIGLVERLLGCLEEEGKKPRWFCDGVKLKPKRSQLCLRC